MKRQGSIADVLAGRADWTVAQADCLELLPMLPASSVDLLVTDPPYAVSNEGMWHIGRPGKGKRRFDFFDGDSDWPTMVRTVARACREAIRLLRPAGSAYLWVGHREFGPVVRTFERAGFKTRFLVWAKAAPSPPPPGSGWPSGAELCVYAYREGRTWNHDGRNPPPNSVITCDAFRHGQPGKVDHPTQKPLATLEPLIAASARPGGLVLDCFAGSASVGVAATARGCRFIGIERDERYHRLAVDRLTAESRGQSLKQFRLGQGHLFADAGGMK